MIYVIYMAAGNSRRFGSNKLLYPFEGKPLYRHTLDRLLELQAEAGVNRTVRSEGTKARTRAVTQAKPAEPRVRKRPFELIVVTQYEELQRELEDAGAPLKIVFCPESRRGVSYTIQAGIRAAADLARSGGGFRFDDWLMFAVADQPFLSKRSILALMDAAVYAGEEYGMIQNEMKRNGTMQKNVPHACGAEEKQRTEGISLRCGERVGNPCLFHTSLIPELMKLEGDSGGRRVLKKHRCRYVDIADERELWDIDVQPE